MFTIEDLEKRVANLRAQTEQALQNYNVILGSKLTMEGMLAEAKAAQEVPTPSEAANSECTEKVEAIN